MTLALTLLARAVQNADDARYLLSRLSLTRRSLNPQDAAELALFRALEPLLAVHAGDPCAMWRACPARWRTALASALAIPPWWHQRCEPLPALVAQWAERGGKGWQLPARSGEESPRDPSPAAARSLSQDSATASAPLPRAPYGAALALWQKREVACRQRGTPSPFGDPLHRAAMLEAQARDSERLGLAGHAAAFREKLAELWTEEAAKQRRAQRAALREQAVKRGGVRDAA